MDRGCRLGALLLLGCFVWLSFSTTANASIELRIDGRTISARPALALVGSGLGLATPVLEDEFGFVVDDGDFPVVELRYGDRSALVVVDDRRAIVDNRQIELQVPPRVQGGTLFVPLHLVADIVNLRVEWDVLSGTLALEHRSPAAVPVSPTTSPDAPTPPLTQATPPLTQPTTPTSPTTPTTPTTPPQTMPTSPPPATPTTPTTPTTSAQMTPSPTPTAEAPGTDGVGDSIIVDVAVVDSGTAAGVGAGSGTTAGASVESGITAGASVDSGTTAGVGAGSGTTVSASTDSGSTAGGAADSGTTAPVSRDSMTTDVAAPGSTAAAADPGSIAADPGSIAAGSDSTAAGSDSTVAGSGSAADTGSAAATAAGTGPTAGVGSTSAAQTDSVLAAGQADPASPAIVMDVRVGVVDGRVELAVETDAPVEAHAMFLPNPARLVVDIPRAVLGTGWRTKPGDGAIIEQIRAATTEDGDVRLVADLTAPTGYKLRFHDDTDGFTISLNHQLHLLSAEATAIGGLTMNLRSTGTLRYSVFTLREPARLVIDLAGATIDGPREVTPEGQFASAVRLSQFAHDVVRIVLELRGSSTAALFAGRLNGGIEGEVVPSADGSFSLTMHPLTGFAVERKQVDHALGTVRYVGLMQHAGTEFVLIEADAPLDPELRRFREPERLVLDLPGAQVERSLGLVGGPEDLGVVGTVRAGQAEPSVSRIVVETIGIVEHHLLFSDDRKRVAIALRPSQLGGRTIVVDPGHGGRDPGAIGYSGTYEKDVTLPIALHVARMLEQAGATVVLTRDGDATVELSSRSGLANALRADAFVSIHADAVGFGRVASGTSTFYHPENGNASSTSVNRRYAEALQNELLAELQLQDRGVHERAFHVVLNTRMPSALVEVGFIDNPDEEKLLVDPAFQARAAAGIVQGILRFFSEEQRLAVPDTRQLWTTASERAVETFLDGGDVPKDAVALVPTAVLGAVPEPVAHDAGF